MRRMSIKSMTNSHYMNKHTDVPNKDYNFESGVNRDQQLKRYAESLKDLCGVGNLDNDRIDPTSILHLRLYSQCYGIYGLIIENLADEKEIKENQLRNKDNVQNKLSRDVKSYFKDDSQDSKTNMLEQRCESPNVPTQAPKICVADQSQSLNIIDNNENSSETVALANELNDWNLKPKIDCSVLPKPPNVEALFYYNEAIDRTLGYLGICKFSFIEYINYKKQLYGNLKHEPSSKKEKYLENRQMAFKRVDTMNIIALSRYFDLAISGNSKEEIYNQVLPKLSEIDDFKTDMDVVHLADGQWNNVTLRIVLTYQYLLNKLTTTSGIDESDDSNYRRITEGIVRFQKSYDNVRLPIEVYSLIAYLCKDISSTNLVQYLNMFNSAYWVGFM